MDIYDVAHDWANRTDNNGSASAANLYHAGGAIYSYGDHFMIAKHVWNQQNDHAVLFTTQTYSRTTSKHMSIVNSASSHLTKFYVPNPSLTNEELFFSWHSTIITIGHHLENDRKPQKCLIAIQRVYDEVKRYADFFGYQIPDELTEAAAITDLAQFNLHLQHERDRQAAIAAKKQKEQLAEQKKKLKNWRVFKTDYLNTTDGLDYLRLSRTSKSIETTQRVEIPLVTGRQFYKVVLDTIYNGGCKNCPDKLMNRYDVLEINSKFIRVGCHKISLKEIKLFAKQQGWS
jgi:hypothetical protein